MGGGSSTLTEDLNRTKRERDEALSKLQCKKDENQLKTLEIQKQQQRQMFAFELRKHVLEKNHALSKDFQDQIFKTLDKLESSDKNYSASDIAQIITALGASRPTLALLSSRNLNKVAKYIEARAQNTHSDDNPTEENLPDDIWDLDYD